MAERYDFSGWATRNDIKCSDGRTIKRDAFLVNDGQTVPLVWNHQHNEPENVMGHALLKNRPEGVYAYGFFNDTESGAIGKALVQHGDIVALSIYANNLKQNGADVVHGVIREVSLVHSGANPGAYIDSVMIHGENSEEDAVIMFYEKENALELYHAETGKPEENNDDKTVADVFNSMTEEQKTVVYALVGEALKEQADVDDDDEDDEDEGDNRMKHNVFDNDMQDNNYLSHADQEKIIGLAKNKTVGTLQNAISVYAEDSNSLSHGFDDEDLEFLFPEYKDIYPGAPELIERDQGWVSAVINKAHKSPISRIRTRQMDVRGNSLRAKGYQKGKEKTVSGNPSLVNRTTDPQTIYRKDALNRDDIIDITDFDVVEYQYRIMRQNLNEDLALAIMIGDGRDEGSDDKIFENHVRSILNDDDFYAIHGDIDMDAITNELQGTGTTVSFGTNFIYAEAIITKSLYLREQYRGKGNPDFYCTPHLLNVMLLARDMNGRRIYDSKEDLAKALNVGDIHTVEQFEDVVRTDKKGNEHKLLGIFVNMQNYTIGSTRGGEITKFNQFDIDFNQEKYLIETRVSGALTRPYSALVLEEAVGTISG